MNAVVIHLWSSTLVLLAALVAARFLPLTARTRHALLLCGLAKLALPDIVLTAPLRAAGIDLRVLRPASPGAITMEWLGGPQPLRTLTPPVSSDWPYNLIVAWAISAAAIAVAWAIARRRLVSAALKAGSVASPRERSALSAARHRLGLRTSVDIIRSTICEAPAVVRIIRPVVVLPDGGCDALDDAELESLLRHECAHVARRDNLVGLFESAMLAAFWFHPLVWIAQRAIATAREEACDEIAAASATGGVDTYVSALTKVCHAVVAPPLAGVSCMASARLKERIKHLMNYEHLRVHAFSHRLVVAFAAIVVLSVTIASGVRAESVPQEGPYRLVMYVRPIDGGNALEFGGTVVQSATGEGVLTPGIVFKRGSEATVHSTAGGRDISLKIRDAGNEVTIAMRVVEDGVEVQRSTHSVSASQFRPARSARRYTGDPISLDVKDANLKDVLNKFAQLTGLEIRYASEIEGTVTMNVKDLPWDQVFDMVITQNGLTWELDGGVMVIKRR